MWIRDVAALVTGGASGLGAATAKRLAGAGARVAVVDLNGEGAAAVGKEISGIGLACDVTSPKGVEAVIAEATVTIGIPQIVVNCAGIGAAERIMGRNGAMALENFSQVIQVNLIGTFNVMRLAATAMAEAEPQESGERGVIVNTSSVAAFEGQIGQAAYSASKGGVAALTLPAAREFARAGIRVVTIAPGILETPMFDGVPDEAREALIAITQFPKRLGEPDEYAQLVQHIAENTLLNGETIRLDGAVRLPPR